jgi:hypothetical protein
MTAIELAGTAFLSYAKAEPGNCRMLIRQGVLSGIATMIKNFVNKFLKALIGIALISGALFVPAKADDKKLDPTGTYIWITPSRTGGPDHTNTLILKLHGADLTGKILSPRRGGSINITDIDDGKINGARISFSAVRSFPTITFTNYYYGTLTNNDIVGKIVSQRDGQTQTRHWDAKKLGVTD